MWGPAGLVVNGAGVHLISQVDELRGDDRQRQIDLDITDTMTVIAAFLPYPTAAADHGNAADLVSTWSIAATRILEKSLRLAGVARTAVSR